MRFILTSVKENLLLIFLLCFILLISTPVFATKTALIYHSNYSDAHTNVKTQLEADGYTVTLSTTGTVDDNLINSYDVVWDMKYNNSIGSNGKTRYQNFVQAGGVLILVGENNAYYSNNNQTIEAFIENKLGGTVTRVGNTSGCAFNCTNNNNSNTITTTNTDVTDSDYGSDVAVYPYGTYFTGDGTWVAKNGNGQVVWMRWSGDQLPSGYTGAAYITFDINQFQTSFDKAKMANLISDTYTSMTATPQAGITSAQTTKVTNARAISPDGNNVYVTQIGNSNTLTITQDGDDNLVAGTSTTNSSTVNATITGNNNTTTISQKGDDNVVLFDVTGNTNTTTIDQGGTSGADDNRLIMNVNGDTNTVSLTQKHNDGVGNNGHFLDVDIDGDRNNVLTLQQNDGDKKGFISVQGDDNDIDLYQQGTGTHYVEIDVTSDQTVDITQDGSGNMEASVNMSGYSSTLDLDQTGSSNQNYHLEQNCTNSNGCGTTTVTQN